MVPHPNRIGGAWGRLCARSRAGLQKRSNLLPIITVFFAIRDPSCHHFLPAIVAPCGQCDCHWEHIDLGRLFSRLVTRVSLASIEQHKNDEVSVGVLHRKALIGIRSPTALDLDSGRGTGRRIYRKNVVTRHLRVSLICGNSFDKQMGADKEFCALRFKACIQSCRYQLHKSISSRRGSSSASFTRTRNVTAPLPSTIRWS